MNLAGIKVWWQYGSKPVIVKGVTVQHETTTCHVQAIPDGEIISSTISRHHNDQPNWEKARVVTLSHALTGAGINRNKRTQVWLAYKETKPGGRW